MCIRDRSIVHLYTLFDLKFKRMSENTFICVICEKRSMGYGNNPFPVKKDGICCDLCNYQVVIPTRLNIMSADKTQLNDTG